MRSTTKANGMAWVALEGGLSTEGVIAAEKDGVIEIDIVADARREDGAEAIKSGEASKNPLKFVEEASG